MSQNEKDALGNSAATDEETKPINNVDKAEQPEVVVVKKSRRPGCFVTRVQTIVALVVVVVLLLIFAIVAGVVGWSIGRCDKESSANGAFNSSRYITPRPTVDPSLPWADIRLPRTLIPSLYDLELKVDLTNFIFSGSVEIKVKAEESTYYVIVHVHDLEIAESGVSVRDFGTGQEVPIQKHRTEPINQFYILEMREELQKGRHYLVKFGDFTGPLKDDLRGLYRSMYKTSDGETRYLAASQLQSVDARKVFPCLDEPDLKAIFNVSITHKSEFTALSNMPTVGRQERLPDDWVTDRYQPTPVMSTYLLAFVVADFRSREKTHGDLQIRIWAQPDMEEQTHYALEFASKAYSFFSTYFNTPEVVPKADHVAIPDFSAGAMENWGLVIYREVALLHDDELSSISNKYWVSLILAHEIAHTWFGNMVTMEWWDDLWLNEGFANTLMYFAMNDIYPSWKVFDLQVVGNLFPVMTKDSLLTSHAISAPIVHPDDITQYFDSISYDKGMAVLRLLRGFLGWNDFRRGLQTYIEKYKFKNAQMKDLWQTFEEAVDHRHNVGEIMDTWTRQMGFPVVTVHRVRGNTYLLNQTRFLLNPNDTSDSTDSPFGYKWRIPFSYKTQYDRNPRTMWMNMDSAEITIPAGSWIIGNVDYMGFYRTNYDIPMWAKLTEQLHRNHSVFSPTNRAGLISDAFNLARANMLSYEIALNLSLYLKNEEDFVPWKAFLDSIDFIRGMLSTSNSYGLLKKYITELVAPVQARVGTSDQGNLLERNLRRAMLEITAAVGVPAALKFAQDQFESWMEFGTKISPDYAGVAYSVGVQQGGETEWDFLWKKAKNTRVASETEVMMAALARSTHPWLLWRYARWSLDSSKIRMQDVRNLFRYFSVSPLGRSVALQFMLTDWKEINEKFGMDPFLLRDIIYATTSLINTDFEYKQLDTLYKVSPPTGFASKAAENSLALVRSNIYWMNLNHDVIYRWLKQNVENDEDAY